MTDPLGPSSTSLEDPVAIAIRAVRDDEMDLVRALFREYETWLQVDLCFQDFEAELASLPGAYAPPSGGLWFAETDAKDIAGVVAIRPQGDGACELKRLWIRPGFRGAGLGRRLVETAIAAARAADYQAMRLDTLADKMATAQTLYESLGFVDIAPYYDNPYPVVRFLELVLTAERGLE